MRIEYAKAAVKVINGMDRPTKRRVREAIEKLPQGDVKILRGVKDGYRLRVGDWRVLFSYAGGETIFIEKIGPRGEIYKGV